MIIKYTLGHPPICVVKDPDLSVLAEGQLSHILRNQTGIKGTQLCLYLPVIKKKNKISEWQPTMLLSDTILPWASPHGYFALSFGCITAFGTVVALNMT